MNSPLQYPVIADFPGIWEKAICFLQVNLSYSLLWRDLTPKGNYISSEMYKLPIHRFLL